MKKTELENILNAWFEDMLSKYDWLSFKYEFDEKRNVFLVSYFPADKINTNDEFCRDAMAFEDKVNYLYGDDAPLFEDEETLFPLSEKAIVISNTKFKKPDFEAAQWTGIPLAFSYNDFSNFSIAA